MDEKAFTELVARLDEDCQAILFDRARVYADESDRLENFREITALTGVSPEKVCMILQSKHFVALAKAVQCQEYDRAHEYIVDIINYQRLLWALIQEQITPATPNYNSSSLRQL